MSEEDFKSRITELENELEIKEQQKFKYLERIEELEDNIIKFQELISNENSELPHDKLKKAKNSILEMELKEKEKEIRDLKDRMGFLRKDKIQLQRELEGYTKQKNSSTVIRIEEKKEPFETLVTDLQNKINKQQLKIAELKAQSKKDGSEILKANISKLDQQLNTVDSSEEEHDITLLLKATPEQLRKKLIKSVRKIKILEDKVNKLKIKNKKSKSTKSKSLSDESKTVIDMLNKELKSKVDKIAELNNKILALEQSKELNIRNQKKESLEVSNATQIDNLTKTQNKKKVDVKNLHQQLEYYKIQKGPINNLELRFRELCNLIEDLKTQNYQQRLEISKLRKE